MAPNPDSSLPLGDVFMRWKPKFVLYSKFCSEMPKAQKRIERLCSESSSVKAKIVVKVTIHVFWGFVCGDRIGIRGWMQTSNLGGGRLEAPNPTHYHFQIF